jgi:hypothetical protein
VMGDKQGNGAGLSVQSNRRRSNCAEIIVCAAIEKCPFIAVEQVIAVKNLVHIYL